LGYGRDREAVSMMNRLVIGHHQSQIDLYQLISMAIHATEKRLY
jgi:hypothetical protein